MGHPNPWGRRTLTRVSISGGYRALGGILQLAVRRYLEAMTEAELHRFDAAHYDDEELSDEDLRAVEEARSEAGISWSDAEAELNAG